MITVSKNKTAAIESWVESLVQNDVWISKSPYVNYNQWLMKLQAHENVLWPCERIILFNSPGAVCTNFIAEVKDIKETKCHTFLQYTPSQFS